MEQVNMAIPKIFSHPLGHGIGTSAEVLGFTNPAGTLTIDSYYLVIALDYGIIGFLMFYGLFILAIFYSIKHAVKEPDPRSEVTFLEIGRASCRERVCQYG